MTTHMGYKFRIYPNEEQEILIQKTFGCCRYVFNYFLAERIEQYEETGHSPTRFQQDKSLTALKQELPWLCEPDSSALKESIHALDVAYQNFFRRVKNGEAPGFPRFKSKRDNHRSYRTTQATSIKVFNNAVQLPKLGIVKCRISREVKGRVLSAVVSQNPSGKYFVSLNCTDVEVEPLPDTGAVVGINIDPECSAVTSDGAELLNNQYYVRSQEKLARLQRQLSRKTKGSNRYEKARLKIARLHEHIANQRTDTLQKWSTDLVRDYDVIALKDIPLASTVKDAEDSETPKYILDAAWGEFRRQLEYKSEWYGRKISIVDSDFTPAGEGAAAAESVLSEGLRLLAQ